VRNYNEKNNRGNNIQYYNKYSHNRLDVTGEESRVCKEWYQNIKWGFIMRIAMYVWLLVGLMVGISLVNKTIVLNMKVDKIEKELQESNLRVKVLTILNRENIKRRDEKKKKKSEYMARFQGVI